MTYLTEKNDRRYRRNAKMLTALIALTMFAIFAYYGGLLDASFFDAAGPAEQLSAQAPVATVNP